MSGAARCPACASSLLHPQRLRSEGGRLTLDLRCAECGRWSEGVVSRCELEALERDRAAGRRELLRAYDRCVAESMEALAECLAVALERDLVGPDDFAPRRAMAG